MLLRGGAGRGNHRVGECVVLRFAVWPARAFGGHGTQAAKQTPCIGWSACLSFSSFPHRSIRSIDRPRPSISLCGRRVFVLPLLIERPTRAADQTDQMSIFCKSKRAFLSRRSLVASFSLGEADTRPRRLLQTALTPIVEPHPQRRTHQATMPKRLRPQSHELAGAARRKPSLPPSRAGAYLSCRAKGRFR